MTDTELFLQLLIIGLSNGMIIALIALGYTMVYGILELINFAHGEVFMLGSFLTLTLVEYVQPGPQLFCFFLMVPVFCALLNWTIDRLAYRPLRKAPRLAPLVAAIGVSFILMNIGLFWGGLPLSVFGGGQSAAAPKNFPEFFSNTNLLGESSSVIFTLKDFVVFLVTIPVMLALTLFVKYTKLGKAMRAVAQNPIAAKLMGIDPNKVIGVTFMIGGVLAGIASIIYALYNNTIHFQMGYRAGMDAFTAAVLGGIGNLPGALLGGLLIGLIRAMSDQYLAAEWTNAMVFAVLILILVLRPSGLLGARLKEKV